MNLKDKVVIVTGSARGLGKSYALRFSREGARVVVCDVLDCNEIAHEIKSQGGEVLSLKTDVASEESTLELANKTVERFGRIDVLVNNAALQPATLHNGIRPPFWEISVENWDKIMAVNLRGVFLCCKAVFRFMKEQRKGKIVNIASTVVFSGTPFFAHYSASKGGVIAFTRAIARELGDYNIHVNAIAPGLTMTKFIQDTAPKEFTGKNIASRCLKREEQPEDLEGTVMFLSSEESDFITGQVVVVDGGYVLH